VFIELITTGSELLLGATLNSHQQWIGQRLASLGMPVNRQLTVPDAGTAIADAVAEALTRSDVVLVTGGLGPTADDRTRDEIARLLDLKLRTNEAVLLQIEKMFKRTGRPLPPNYKTLAHIQAQVPDGALVLKNENGSAPGLAIDIPPGRFGRRTTAGLLVLLPGPPREMRPMFDAGVTPLLKARYPDATGFVSRTFHTLGIGESRVEDAVAPHLQQLIERGLELGFCARSGEVDIRLTATGKSASEFVEEASAIVRRLMREHVYSDDGSSLEQVVVRELQRQGKRVITAESCTGGFVAHTLTNVSGASDVFPGGLVTYSNELKHTLLGVSPGTLATHGAVSEETALEMAVGARDRYAADYAIAITGIAGPTGGTESKPVGTVCIGLAYPNGAAVRREFNPYERETFKFMTGRQSLDMLWRRLLIDGK
jgi:nicotinamide-nucleotide amidase